MSEEKNKIAMKHLVDSDSMDSKTRFFLISLVMYEFIVYMANDLIMPSMLNVIKEFNASELMIPWSLSLYMLGGLLLQIVMGPISDRWGRRPTMLVGVSFFCISTLAIMISGSIFDFLAARFLQGMGLCFIAVCGYALVQEMFDEKSSVRVIAWMASVSVLAPILGPIVGGVVARNEDWRWVFVGTFIGSLISLIGLTWTMPETPRMANAKNPQKFWQLIYQGFLDYKQGLKSKKLILGGLLSGLSSAPLLCWIAVSPMVLFGASEAGGYEYGLVQVPIFGCFILGTTLLRYLTYRKSLEEILKLGFLISFVSLVLLLIAPMIYPKNYWSLIIPLSCYCFGNGILTAPLTRISLFSSNAKKGLASGVFGMVASVVMILAVSTVSFVFEDNFFHFSLFCGFMGLILLVLVPIFLGLKGDDGSEKVDSLGES